MPSYMAPNQDIQFVLHEVLKVAQNDTPGYDELDAEFTSAVLEEAGKLASEVLAPLNTVGDTEGCTLENGIVRTPTGFKATPVQLGDASGDTVIVRSGLTGNEQIATTGSFTLKAEIGKGEASHED